MAQRPVVHIALPPMPNPKDFRVSNNATADMGNFHIALNAWEKVAQSVATAVAAALAPDSERGAVAEPIVPVTADRSKN